MAKVQSYFIILLSLGVRKDILRMEAGLNPGQVRQIKYPNPHLQPSCSYLLISWARLWAVGSWRDLEWIHIDIRRACKVHQEIPQAQELWSRPSHCEVTAQTAIPVCRPKPAGQSAGRNVLVFCQKCPRQKGKAALARGVCFISLPPILLKLMSGCYFFIHMNYYTKHINNNNNINASIWFN